MNAERGATRPKKHLPITFYYLGTGGCLVEQIRVGQLELHFELLSWRIIRQWLCGRKYEAVKKFGRSELIRFINKAG